MKIGVALKTQRLAMGLSQTEMAAGIVSESYYSKVERGLHEIDAETLIKILRAHNLSFQTFAEMIGNTENNQEVKERQKDADGIDTYDLSLRISRAQSAGDRAALDRIKHELEEKNAPDWWMKFVRRAYSWVDHNGDSFSPEEKMVLKKRMFKNNKWDMLTPYSTIQLNIWILDFEDIYQIVNQAIHGFEKVKDPGFTLEITAGTMAIAFLTRCQEQKVDKKYTKTAIEFLRNRSYSPQNLNSLLMGAYFEAYFNGDLEKAKRIYHSYDYVKDFIGKKG